VRAPLPGGRLLHIGLSATRNGPLIFTVAATGKKISIALEEMKLPHTLKPINIGSNVDQFTADFKAISPNSKIPAIGECVRVSEATQSHIHIREVVPFEVLLSMPTSCALALPDCTVDYSTADGKPQTVFESGAILLYLAEKTGACIEPTFHSTSLYHHHLIAPLSTVVLQAASCPVRHAQGWLAWSGCFSRSEDSVRSQVKPITFSVKTKHTRKQTHTPSTGISPRRDDCTG
jgi:hypothetical protein